MSFCLIVFDNDLFQEVGNRIVVLVDKDHFQIMVKIGVIRIEVGVYLTIKTMRFYNFPQEIIIIECTHCYKIKKRPDQY